MFPKAAKGRWSRTSSRSGKYCRSRRWPDRKFTEDRRYGMNAFAEKRKPLFRNR